VERKLWNAYKIDPEGISSTMAKIKITNDFSTFVIVEEMPSVQD
jgi:hypothetical protein